LTPPAAAAASIPDKGDLVYEDFTPTSGHEQAGVSPALVLSPKVYNEKSGLMLCCPITTKVKGYPFEVEVHGGVSGLTGVALTDQIKSLDWRHRRVAVKGKVIAATLAEVIAKVHALLTT
jgi:mRNA interferase MazF